MIILTKSEVLKDKGFPGSSTGKESSCNTEDPGMISGLGRYPGEGIGYPLQYSWASLMVQTVKNPPVMRETWIQSLGWEEPPWRRAWQPLQYACLENPMDRKHPGELQSMGLLRVRQD